MSFLHIVYLNTEPQTKKMKSITLRDGTEITEMDIDHAPTAFDKLKSELAELRKEMQCMETLLSDVESKIDSKGVDFAEVEDDASKLAELLETAARIADWAKYYASELSDAQNAD